MKRRSSTKGHTRKIKSKSGAKKIVCVEGDHHETWGGHLGRFRGLVRTSKKVGTTPSLSGILRHLRSHLQKLWGISEVWPHGRM